MKKKVKKKRIKIIPVLVLLSTIFLIYLSISKFISLKTNNIFISGNEILNDQQVIDIAKLDDYPKYYKYTTSQIEKRIKTNAFVKDVKVSRKFFHSFDIKITENKILMYDYSSSMYILSNGKKVGLDKKINGVPTLVNYVTDDVYNKFIKKLNNINEDILVQVSEIKYDPSSYDQTRFFLTMNDGNYVYVNVSNLKTLNLYDDIYPNFNGHKGILYLDSGYGQASEYKIIK